MHLRKTSVKRKNKHYTYVQIVESFRRSKDGMPTVKVLSNLGQLSELEFENLRSAFEASRTGKTVVVKESTLTKQKNDYLKPRQNLAFLDIAVLFELWQEWRLDEIMSKELFADNRKEVDPGKIIFILVAHRCTDPGSKLSTTRWFPRTSLPELLSINPVSFNNTRIHRALELIERANFQLMAKLTRLYRERKGAFATVFLDVTDTWFVGQGPSLAEMGKTKEGLLRKKIGIVLLCNEDGFPIRWDVIIGNQNDSITMTDMIESIKSVSWMKGVPLVCDRAMGKTAQIADLSSMGVFYVTALTRTEFATYTTDLPLLELIEEDLEDKQKLVEIATKKIKATPWIEIDESLFVFDFGVVKRTLPYTSKSASKNDTNYVSEAMRICHKIEQMVAEGEYDSYRAAGSALGLKKSLAYKYCRLQQLPLDIQDRIIRGEAENSTLDNLISLTKLTSSEEIIEKFEELSKIPKRKKNPMNLTNSNCEKDIELELRVVAYFNPVIFADQRIGAAKKLDKVRRFESELNSRLNSSRKFRSTESISSEVDRFLRRDGLLTAFKTIIKNVETGGRHVQQVNLELDHKDWEKRGRYHGFTVLVAHPKIDLDAQQLCQLYREKNTVEAGFRSIKSCLDIRPVHHRTDLKVKAHTSVCMLALLLERTLRKKLGSKYSSAQAALEILEPCYLNRYISGKGSLYVVTEIDKEQRTLLKHLDALHLADDDVIRDRIVSRT
ncbi:transposase [Candidatus Peregrinibacteria bacterium]|nr:transposase [Candidatus Peregrinibacteria bacterium]